MTDQRFLVLPVHEPFDPYQPVVIESATLEFDLVKKTVRLPGGFVCSLADLAHVVGKALVAQEELNPGPFSLWAGNTRSLKERGKKGPYL